MIPEPASVRRRSRTWVVLRAVLSIAIVAGIFLGVMPAIASYSDVWKTIGDMSWFEVAVLIAVGLWNLSTYWLVMVAVLPGLTTGQAALVNQASTAVANTLPAGGAVGVGVSFAMYRSWGFTNRPIVLATIVSGIWNNPVRFGLPIVALALVVIGGEVGSALVLGAAVGLGMLVGVIVVLGLVVHSRGLARRIGGLAGRAVSRVRGWFRRAPVTTWSESWDAFSGGAADLIRDRWLRISATTSMSHLSLYVVLLVALREVGVAESAVSWVEVLTAFAFVRLLSALPITPGSVGVVELGYAAALGVGLDAIGKAQVVAAVLVFRVVASLLPIPQGVASYLLWRRRAGDLGVSDRGNRASTTAVPMTEQLDIGEDD